MTDASDPEVSVIIPTYNRASFICQAIDSALKQQGPKIEIVVIDDGSTDDTQQVLGAYIRSGSIQYYQQGNRGPSAARNLGIRKSRGALICFLDSDDILLEDSIRVRWAALKRHRELGLVCADFRKFTLEDHRPVFSDNILHNGRFTTSHTEDYIARTADNTIFFRREISYDLMLLRNLISIGTVMVPRTVLDDVGYFDEDLSIAEDIDLWFRIANRHSMAFLTICTAAYLSHQNNITRNVSLYYESTITVLKRYLANFEAMPPASRKAIVSRMADYYFIIGYRHYEGSCYAASRRYFLSAVRTNPSNLEHWRYAALVCMPTWAIKALRNLKQRLRRTGSWS